MGSIKLSSAKELLDAIKEDSIVVVKVSRDGCAPCKAVSPMYERLADTSETEAVFYSLHSEGSDDGIPEYLQTLNIAGVPAFLRFEDGVLTQTLIGAHPLSVLSSKLDT